MSSLSLPEKPNKWKNTNSADIIYDMPNVVLIDEKQWLYLRSRYRMSPRELEIAKLVCRGLANKDIAQDIKIRPGTVKTHLRSIFKKARVNNKITMLLRFMEDIVKLQRESHDDASGSDTQQQEPPKQTTTYIEQDR